MVSYYATTLAGERLRRCYELAPPRVQRYLREEARFVSERLDRSDAVLELGCGYGRVMWQLAEAHRFVVGIDISLTSLALARALTGVRLSCHVAAADAARLAFRPASFDAVVCVQNGICAFHGDQAAVLGEALRVVRTPGRVLVSTYSDDFWPDRLDWFRRQAAEGLVGAIDEGATRRGTIVCRDGFSVGTMAADGFRALCSRLGVTPRLAEVDGSSLFCEITV